MPSWEMSLKTRTKSPDSDAAAAGRSSSCHNNPCQGKMRVGSWWAMPSQQDGVGVCLHGKQIKVRQGVLIAVWSAVNLYCPYPQ